MTTYTAYIVIRFIPKYQTGALKFCAKNKVQMYLTTTQRKCTESHPNIVDTNKDNINYTVLRQIMTNY